MTKLSTEAEIPLTGGADSWHTHEVPQDDLSAIMMTDGPHGVRKEVGDTAMMVASQTEPATCFPPAVALASTWNPDLVHEMGVALARECKSLGVSIILGPGMNIKRSPLCGRNFEYFSEDPFLAGELAAALVEGVQSQGVGASVKHFAANNQETDRMRRDSMIDQRTLREIYLRGFSKVVRRARPWTVMCSYNKLNGTYASENHFLLTEVLRQEWGFDGLVMSDWGAVHDRVKALTAGLDLEMPAHPAHEEAVRQALAAGQIEAGVIDQAYQRVAAVVRRCQENLEQDPAPIEVEAHHALARRVAEQCVVLLANDGVLPLARETKVAVIGEFARTPRYQGAGSSRVNPTKLVGALDAITELLGHEVAFAPGFTTAPGQTLPDTAHDDAVAAARQAEVVLAFLGLGEDQESEGYDRTTMDLPAEQLALLDDILAVNPNVVVVLSNGASVLLPFADRVRAVVEGWLLGQAGGPALADVLYGLVNPSGKIAETIPRRLQDVPSYLDFPGDRSGVRYGEGLFVGYRGYDARETAVAFPFGHGLSYTSFAYSDLGVAVTDQGMTVEATVANTGRRAGREVVQVYLSVPGSSVVRAPRELKGFAGVELAPGESRRVRIEVAREDLTFWSVADQAWLLESGDYLVSVGSSSRDLRLAATVAVTGDEPVRPLTMSSTVQEALAIPAVGQLLAQMAGAIPGGAEGLAMLKTMGDIPLETVAGFSGQEVAIQALIDQVNAQLRE